jgi:hypothetical protein
LFVTGPQEATIPDHQVTCQLHLTRPFASNSDGVSKPVSHSFPSLTVKPHAQDRFRWHRRIVNCIGDPVTRQCDQRFLDLQLSRVG